MKFQESFVQFLRQKYKDLESFDVLSGATLFLDVCIEFRLDHFQLIKDAIKGFFAVRQGLFQHQALGFPPNHSVMMSYDFHITEDGPKLIEINTNAGQALYAYNLYQFKNENLNCLDETFPVSLRKSFFEEASHFGSPENLSVAIVDENVKQQFFYPEFLMFKSEMQSWGWKVAICEPSELTVNDGLLGPNGRISLIYNRLTDFYLDKFPHIKAAFKELKICLTPQPVEYDLLANKKRLVEFSNPQFLTQYLKDQNLRDACTKVLPMTRKISQFHPDELWTQRKKYFFKPSQAFAGKGVYRGEGIQKKIFYEICRKDYLVQDFLRPPEIEIRTESDGTEKVKYDLRFYVYKDQVILVSARAYQGQVTNFRSALSGICTVRIVEKQK